MHKQFVIRQLHVHEFNPYITCTCIWPSKPEMEFFSDRIESQPTVIHTVLLRGTCTLCSYVASNCQWHSIFPFPYVQIRVADI